MKYYAWFIFFLLMIQSLAFLVGFGPFEDNITKKRFLPKNKALKVLTIIAILLAFSTLLGVAISQTNGSRSNTCATHILLTDI